MWPSSEQTSGGLIRVVYDAVTRAAVEERAVRNALIRVQDERRDAALPPEALGRILPSQDLLAAVGRADAATRHRLWDQAHRCQDLHETLRAFRNEVRVVDEDVAGRFDSLRHSLTAGPALGPGLPADGLVSDDTVGDAA